MLAQRSWLAGDFCDEWGFFWETRWNLVGLLVDGVSLHYLSRFEWIRDSFGGCSRGDCGWELCSELGSFGVLFHTKALYPIKISPSVEASGCQYHEGMSNEWAFSLL